MEGQKPSLKIGLFQFAPQTLARNPFFPQSYSNSVQEAFDLRTAIRAQNVAGKFMRQHTAEAYRELHRETLKIGALTLSGLYGV